MHYEYDSDVQALYVYLSEAPVAYTKALDASRIVDYGQDDQPRGVELLNVDLGVRLEGLPERDKVARVLGECNIPVSA
jgi:uncharacterized protein YuzE